MDGPPAQSLGVEPADRQLVVGKPRPRHLKLLNRGLATRVLINAFLVGGFDITLTLLFVLIRKREGHSPLSTILDDIIILKHNEISTFNVYHF